MAVGNVSFKNVVAVTGSRGKMSKFNEAMRRTPYFKKGQVMQTDVTSHYRYASPTGLIAETVQNGGFVYVYVTGKDVENVRQHEAGWDTLDGVLSQLTKFVRIDKYNPEEAVQKVIDN